MDQGECVWAPQSSLHIHAVWEPFWNAERMRQHGMMSSKAFKLLLSEYVCCKSSPNCSKGFCICTLHRHRLSRPSLGARNQTSSPQGGILQVARFVWLYASHLSITKTWREKMHSIPGIKLESCRIVFEHINVRIWDSLGSSSIPSGQE